MNVEDKEIPIIPKEIDINIWFKRIETEDRDFLDSLNEDIYDKIGINGERLFSLTIDNESSKMVHRTVTTISGDSVSKTLMCGLCPELETFVTLTNWMGSAENRNLKRLGMHRDFENFIEKNDPNKVCKINGNYRLKSREYFNVLLFRGQVSFENKTKSYYDWERAPFIKRSSETFMYFPSPIFMPSFTSNMEKGVSEVNLSYFTAAFSLKSIRNNVATIHLYSVNSPYKGVIDVFVDNQETIDILQNKNGIYLGLFKEMIYKKSNKVISEFYLVKLSYNPLNGDEFAGHFISMRMYYNYLRHRKLYICTDYQLIERCKKFFYQMEKSYNIKATMNFEDFLNLFIKAYFVKIDNYWYYKPYILKDMLDEDFKKLLKYIELYDKYERGQAKITDFIIEFTHKLQYFKKYHRILNILNCFNFYSKLDLILRINSQGEEGSKWMI